MYCLRCSQYLTEDLIFCTNCGAPTGKSRVDEQETVVRPKGGSENTFTGSPLSETRSSASWSVQNILIGFGAACLLFLGAYLLFRDNKPLQTSNMVNTARNTEVAKTSPPAVKTPPPENSNAPATQTVQPPEVANPPPPANTQIDERAINAVRPPVNRPANMSRRGPTSIFNKTVDIGDSGRVVMWQSFVVGPKGGVVVGHLEGQGGIKGEFECFITDDDGLTVLRNGGSAQVFYNSGRVVVAKINQPLNPGLYYLVFRNQSPWTRRNVSGQVLLNEN